MFEISDPVGDYLNKDTKRLIKWIESPLMDKDAPGIAEDVLTLFYKFSKALCEYPRGSEEFVNVLEQYAHKAGRLRRENITELGDQNPSWLSASLYEALVVIEVSYLHTKKLRAKNINEIRANIKNFLFRYIDDEGFERFQEIDELRAKANGDSEQETEEKKIGNLIIKI